MIFDKIRFTCAECAHSTDIFFEPNVSILEVKDIANCGTCDISKYLCVGDLGYRNDWPDPDFPSWQAQIIRINIENARCEECLQVGLKNPTIYDFIAYCPICNNNRMYVTKKETCENDDLKRRLNQINTKDY
jgi:uncharacterized protein YuzB (UPF0349 family)